MLTNSLKKKKIQNMAENERKNMKDLTVRERNKSWTIS